MLVLNDLTETNGKTTLLEPTVNVVGRPSVFDNDAVQVKAPFGLTVLEIVGHNHSDNIFITLDGVVIPESNWGRITPKPDTILEIYRKPEGDNAKTAVILAATIALTTATFGAGGMTAAGYAGSWLSGAVGGAIGAGVSTALVTAGIYLIGGALVPPANVSEMGVVEATSVGRYNAISSTNNGYNLYGPIPKNYGKVWMVPPNVSKPYTEVNGDKQWVNILLAIGYGPLRVAGYDVIDSNTLVNQSSLDLSKIKIGDTTIDNFTDYDIQVGYAPNITLFKHSLNEARIDTTFDTDGQSHVRTTDFDSKSAVIDITFPQGLWTHSGTKRGNVGQVLGYRINTLANTVIHSQTNLGRLAKVNDSDSYLYWLPPPVLGDGTFNTYGVYRLTATNQTITLGINFTILNGVTTINTVTNTYGVPEPYTMPSPEFTGDGVLYKLEYAATGSDNWQPAITNQSLPAGQFYVSGDKDPFAVSKSVTFPSAGAFDIRVTRLTTFETYTEQSYVNSVWTVLRSEAEDETLKFKLPEVVTMAIRFRATDQISGTLDDVSLEVESLLEQIGVSKTVVPSSNPADIAYDVLTGPQCEFPVSISQLDMPALYKFRKWCVRENLSYSWSHNSDETILQRLQAVCAAGLATWAIDNEGKFTFIVDLPLEPTHVITPRNSWGFSMTKQYLDLPDAFRVKYLDVTTRQTMERIVARDGVTNPQKFESLDTQGITDSDHAFKYGRYHLAQAILRPETFTVTQGAEVIGVTRGDVVRLSYDSMLVGVAWGRIKSFTTTSVTLDEAVPIVDGTNYSIIIRHGNGTQSMVNVTGSAGYQNTLAWSAIPAFTDVGDLVTFGEAGKVTVDAKVTNVMPNASDSSATLTLVNAAQGITKVFDEPIPAFNPFITTPVHLRLPETPIIESVTSDVANLWKDGLGSYQASIAVNWSQSSNVVPIVSVEVLYVRLTGQNGDESDKQYRQLFTVSDKTLILTDVVEGSWYRVWVSTITQAGKRSLLSNPVEVRAFDVNTLLAGLTVGNFQVQSGTDQLLIGTDGTIIERALLSWTPPTIAFENYEIRYKQAGGDYYNQVVSASLNYAYAVNVRSGLNFSFEIRAVHPTGFKPDWQAISHTVIGKTEPPGLVENFTGEVTPYSIALSWDSVPDLDLRHYEIRHGVDWDTGELVTSTNSNTYTWSVVPTGLEKLWIKAVDTTGNFSELPTKATVVINNPITPIVTAQVVDNFTLLRWQDCTTSFGIAKYMVYKNGTTAGDLLFEVTGTAQTSFEVASGTYTYYVKAIDTNGNESAFGEITAIVDQPTDFVLYGSHDFDVTNPDASGNLCIEPNEVDAPFNVTETYAEHFTNNSATSFQDLIDAGFDRYAMPTPSTAYWEATHDFGAQISISRIRCLDTIPIVSGSPVVQLTISYSSDNINWTDEITNTGDIVGRNFRYVKIRYDITSTSGIDLLKIEAVKILLDVKQFTDNGSVIADANDVDGTVVNFNKTFSDVISINVSVNSTTNDLVVYDFVDTPNPVSFKVLAWDQNGVRKTVNVSWTVRGI